MLEEKYSIWLNVDSPVITDWINKGAKDVKGSPPFSAHITLMGGIKDGKSKDLLEQQFNAYVKKCKEILSSSTASCPASSSSSSSSSLPFLEGKSITKGSSFFHNVVIDVRPTQAYPSDILQLLHREGRRIFFPDEDSSVKGSSRPPHVSLLYSDPLHPAAAEFYKEAMLEESSILSAMSSTPTTTISLMSTGSDISKWSAVFTKSIKG